MNPSETLEQEAEIITTNVSEMVLPVWTLNDAVIQRLREASPGTHILVLPSWDDECKSAVVAPVKVEAL